MFTRVVPKAPTGPEREQLTEELICPPHDFEAAWASPPDAKDHDDTAPALYCRSCGEVRAFKIPAE